MLVTLTIVGNDGAVGIGHFQAVDHHQGFDVGVNGTTPGDQHLGQVGILEIQFPFNVIVLFVKSTASYEDLNHYLIKLGRDAILHRVST